MRISVFGLGYVGTVSAGCLAHDGHEVIGVDPVRKKWTRSMVCNRLLLGRYRGIIASTVKSGRLRATEDQDQAIRDTELSFVCVGNPSQTNGNLDLRFIRRVCELIGQALRNNTDSPYGGDPQHNLTGHHASNRDSGVGGIFRQKSRRGFRRMQQSGISQGRFSGQGF